MDAIQDALSVDAVRHVHAWRGPNGLHALVATRDTEFDCRETSDGWIVNDDEGRNFMGATLSDAVRFAIEGQQVS